MSSVAELFSNGFVSVAGNRHFSLNLQCLSSLKRFVPLYVPVKLFTNYEYFTSKVILNKVNLHFTVR